MDFHERPVGILHRASSIVGARKSLVIGFFPGIALANDRRDIFSLRINKLGKREVCHETPAEFISRKWVEDARQSTAAARDATCH